MLHASREERGANVGATRYEGLSNTSNLVIKRGVRRSPNLYDVING